METVAALFSVFLVFFHNEPTEINRVFFLFLHYMISFDIRMLLPFWKVFAFGIVLFTLTQK